jgi:hypothetical protein
MYHHLSIYTLSHSFLLRFIPSHTRSYSQNGETYNQVVPTSSCPVCTGYCATPATPVWQPAGPRQILDSFLGASLVPSSINVSAYANSAGYGYLTENIVASTVSGSIQRVINPSANVVLVATSNGGLWRTGNLWDGGSTSLTPAALTAPYFPRWSPVSDSFGCSSMAALHALDDMNMVAGCGITNAKYVGSLAGAFKSVDGGITWSPLGFPLHHDITDALMLSPSTVIISTKAYRYQSGGIWRTTAASAGGIALSTDGGSSWTWAANGNNLAQPINSNINTPPTSVNGLAVYQLASLGSSNTAFAVASVAGVLSFLVSTNSGATWTTSNSGDIASDILSVSAPASRPSNAVLSVAITPDGTVVLYLGVFACCLSDPTAPRYQVYRATYPALVWRAMGQPATTELDGSVYSLGSEGDYSFAILADRRNASVFYVAGSYISPGALAGRVKETARVLRGDVASGGSAAAYSSFAGKGGTRSGSAPHANTHALSYALNGKILMATDGGLYFRSTTSVVGDWQVLNGDLAISDLLSIAYDGTSDTLVVGSVGNGPLLPVTDSSLKASGLYATAGVDHRDSGTVVLDRNDRSLSNPRVYASGPNYRSMFGQYLTSLTSSSLLYYVNSTAMGASPYLPLYVVNSVVAGRLLTCNTFANGTSGCYYFTLGASSSILTAIVQVGSVYFDYFLSGGILSGVANANVIVAVSSTSYSAGDITTTNNTMSARQAPWFSASDPPVPQGLCSNPTNANELVAVFSGPDAIWYSSNMGASWVNIYSASFATAASFAQDASPMGCVVIPVTPWLVNNSTKRNATTALVVGTRLGPLVAFSDGPTAWTSLSASRFSSSSFPPAAVSAMTFDSSNDILHVATLGRGAYKLSQASMLLACVKLENTGEVCSMPAVLAAPTPAPTMAPTTAPTSKAGAFVQIQTTSTWPTPSLLGVNMAHFTEKSNAVSWWRYMNSSGVRIFIGVSSIEASDDLAPVGDSVVDLDSFLARAKALREAEKTNSGFVSDAYINWNTFIAGYSTCCSLNGDGTGNNINLTYALGWFKDNNVDVFAQITASTNRFPIASASDWPNKWELWQHFYAQAFYLGYKYNVRRYSVYNEPDLSPVLPPEEVLARLVICSDAIQVCSI